MPTICFGQLQMHDIWPGQDFHRLAVATNLCMTYLPTYLYLPPLTCTSTPRPALVSVSSWTWKRDFHARMRRAKAGAGAGGGGGATTRHVKWEYYSFYFSDRAAYVTGEGEGERLQEELVETISRNYHSEMENN